jgi:hypothetical protein
MWRKTSSAVAGLLAASALVWLIPSMGSLAQSASFDSRWLAISPAQKADRIGVPKAAFEGKMYFFDLPTVQTTVVIKELRKPADDRKETEGVGRPQNGSMKQIPVVPVRIQPHDVKQKNKLPIGCESSFSPVTTPLMANVSARCLS